MIRRFIGHTLIYGLGPYFPKVASFFILPIITQDLTAVDYGVAGLVSAYVGGISALKDLGLGVVLVNTFYRNPDTYRQDWQEIFGALTIWVIPFSALLGALIFLVMPAEAAHNALWIVLLLVGPLVVCDNTIAIGVRHYQLLEKPTPVVIRSAIYGFVIVGLNLLTISGLKMGYMGWFVSTATATVLLFLMYLKPVFWTFRIRPSFRIKRERLKQHLRIGVPNIPNQYSTYLISASDRVVMDLVQVSTKQLGLYNLGYNFGSYFHYGADMAGIAFKPLLLSSYTGKTAGGLNDAKRLTTFLQISFLVGAVLTSLWLKEAFLILIQNDELRTAYPITIIILMSVCYIPTYYVTYTLLAYEEKIGALLKIFVPAALGNVALNFIFIPRYGIMAAAVTTLFANLYLGFAGYYLKEYRTLPQRIDTRPVLWIVLILGATGGVYALRDASLVTKALITAGILVAVYAALRKYTWPNLKPTEDDEQAPSPDSSS